MPPTSALDRVYVFKNVKLVVGERNCCVSSIKIMLKENAIPMITAVVDPAHVPGDPMEPATVANLDVISEWHSKFMVYANEKKSASLTLEVHNSKGLQQTLSLNDWMVTGAGITGASGSGNFALEVTIQHPACRLDEGSSAVGNLAEEFDVIAEDLEPASDILELLSLLIWKYGNLERVPPPPPSFCPAADGLGALQPTIDASATAMVSKLSQTGDQVPFVLKWNSQVTSLDGSSATYAAWPLQYGACLQEFLTAIKYTVSSYVTALSENTIWELLANEIFPAWSVGLVPTYWEQALLVQPYSPWLRPSIVIWDDQISELTMPGVDPMPIAAVALQGGVPVSNDYSVLTELGMQDEGTMYTDVFYAPPDVANGFKADGRTVRLTVPDWLISAFTVESGEKGSTTAIGKREGLETLVTEESADPDSEAEDPSGNDFMYRQTLFNDALYQVAHQTFLEQFRKLVDTNIHTCLLIEAESADDAKTGLSNSKYIVPGYSASVKSRNTGKVVFDFYITDVVHWIDFQGGFARTEISGRYVRPAAGFEGMSYLTQGTPNPLYAM